MSVIAREPGYAPPVRDLVENFHGNILVYVHWEEHLMFCAGFTFPLPPEMPFGALVQEVLPGVYAQHPDFEKVDWSAVRWTLDGEEFTPDMEKSLKEQNIGHKSLLRFWTPGLNGYRGSFS